MAYPDFIMNLGEVIDLEENQQHEFKECLGRRPVDAIKNTADEYVIAFLNSEGGRIFWGVRDADRIIVGVKLTPAERDELRKTISSKLFEIRPAIDPTVYKIELHPIYHGNLPVPDLYVVEIQVPPVRSDWLFFSGGDETFVRLNGVKKKLKGPEMQQWMLRRTKGEDINTRLQKLQAEAASAFALCARYDPLPHLEVWKAVSRAWWFDSRYLGYDLTPIKRYFELVEQYATLPRSRGSGHNIELWVRSSNLVDAFEAANQMFATLLETST